MTWYYAVGSERKGPVSDLELEELIRAGTINRNTLVWRSGMGEWQALATARPGTFPEDSTVADGTKCSECGKVFPPDELITLSGARVCAQCKPVFLQRLSEGAALGGAEGLRWEGKRIVCRSETPFPDRCIKCNAPANGYRLKRVLYWHHPAYYLLLICSVLVLCSLPILLIIIMIVRKKAILHIGLCEQHRQKRRNAILFAWLLLFGGLGLVIGGIAMGWVWLGLSGAVVMIFGAIYGAVKGRSIGAAKIEKDTVWITGVNLNFLD